MTYFLYNGTFQRYKYWDNMGISISNLPVITSSQRPYSVHTSFPQRLYSVCSEFTACTQRSHGVHSVLTVFMAFSRRAHSVLTVFLALKISIPF